MRLTPETKSSLLEKHGFEKVLIRTGDEEVKWREVPDEEIFEMKLGDLLKGNLRIVIRLRVEGKVMYVVTQEEDRKNFRHKYPEAVIIRLIDILGFFKGSLEGREDLIPTLLLGMAAFPGAKVVG